MADQEACALCGGSGWHATDREGVSGVVRCECAKRSRMDKLLTDAKIPQRHFDCEFDSFEADATFSTKSISDAKFAAEKFVEEYPTSPPIGLLFVGKPGVGKTHLAVSIIKKLIRDRAIQCSFRAFPELLKEIQLSYNRASNTSELTLLSPILESEVLVLDELGAQKPSAWVLDTVGYVLNSRYNDNKVTILTTNFPDHNEAAGSRKGIADSLIDRIGDRMRSRLYEMCKTVTMIGDDFRMKIRQTPNEDAFKAKDENAQYSA
jgi:DNA replication protein DnaC